MPVRNNAPSTVTRRPSQPIRPVPARQLAGDHLAVKARRRRYRRLLPPQTGERGW